MPGPTFGFVKLFASSGSHCPKWADEQHRPAGFKSRLVPDLLLPFIPTLIGLRTFDLVSNRVWWEAATNKQREKDRQTETERDMLYHRYWWHCVFLISVCIYLTPPPRVECDTRSILGQRKRGLNLEFPGCDTKLKIIRIKLEYLKLYICVRISCIQIINLKLCPVGWLGCKMHRLLLCWGVRLPQQVSKIWD